MVSLLCERDDGVQDEMLEQMQAHKDRIHVVSHLCEHADVSLNLLLYGSSDNRKHTVIFSI